MSEAQQATPEQEAQAQAFIDQARQQAMQELQQNMQIELQMRGNALGMAVNANTAGTDPVTIAKTAQVFLEFLKKGEA
jgi:hypothetical protein